MLPDTDSVLRFDGHRMTVVNNRGVWVYELRNPVDADSDSYGPNDYLLITRNGDTMNVVSL